MTAFTELVVEDAARELATAQITAQLFPPRKCLPSTGDHVGTESAPRSTA